MSLRPLHVVCLLVAAVPARADDRQAAAQAAFEEGRRLLANGKLEEACAQMAASQSLDPAPGTLANLASCNEARGLVATSWAQWIEVETLSHTGGNAKREKLAKSHVEALRPRLPRLRIHVVAPGTAIRRNDEVIPAALLDTDIPVDPGAQRLVASAPGMAELTREVTVTEGQLTSVEIPALAPLPAVAPAPTPAPDAVASPGRALRIAGIATAAGGVAVLALGLKFHSDAGALADQVGHATTWSPSLDQKVSDGEAAQRNMRICWVVGGAAVISGAVLGYLGWRAGREVPVVATTGSVVFVSGTF